MKRTLLERLLDVKQLVRVLSVSLGCRCTKTRSLSLISARQPKVRYEPVRFASLCYIIIIPPNANSLWSSTDAE